MGEKLKELREARGLVQRQVAAKLDVDTAYISKIESNEKPLSRQHLRNLASLFDVPESHLLTFWLADKVYEIIKGEPLAERSLEMVKREIRQVQKTGKRGQLRK